MDNMSSMNTTERSQINKLSNNLLHGVKINADFSYVFYNYGGLKVNWEVVGIWFKDSAQEVDYDRDKVFASQGFIKDIDLYKDDLGDIINSRNLIHLVMKPDIIVIRYVFCKTMRKLACIEIQVVDLFQNKRRNVQDRYTVADQANINRCGKIVEKAIFMIP